jgi:pimeloyl-ACP methyl ester carboxylesterase
MRFNKIVVVLFAVIGLALGLTSINATPAVATVEPLLAVHGWNGSRRTWTEGAKPMSVMLDSISDITPPYYFEYPSDQWVTNPQIGRRLAQTIVCYSKLYKHKLILLTHSMGGLAAREALDWADSGAWARDVTGHTITIAPPHLGALPANLESEFWVSVCKAPAFMLSPGLSWLADGPCRDMLASRATAGMSVSSEQLDKLAKFPSGISVKTIAGEVSHRKCPIWGVDWHCTSTTTNSDLVVNVPSATAESTNTGEGDGTTIFKCDADIPVALLTKAWCEHGNLLQAPQVQEEVKRSIQDYIASTKKPQPPPGNKVTLFDRFTFTYLDTWGGAMSEPGDVENIVDYTECSGYVYSCPHIRFYNLDGPYSSQTYGSRPIETIFAGCETPGVSVEPKVIEISGVQAEYYENLCQMDDGLGYFVWYLPSKHLLIDAHDGPDGKLDQDKLNAVLSNIEWQ